MQYIGDDEDTESQRFKLELEGENELVILGLNPSTARGVSKNFPKEKACDDNTIKRIENFSERDWNVPELKIDGFLMLNVCAQSTSDPKSLVCDDKLHEANKKKIAAYLSGKTKISVLLAYGDYISKKAFLRNYLKEIIGLMPKNTQFYHLGDFIGKDKNIPRHIKPQNITQLPITSPLLPCEILINQLQNGNYVCSCKNLQKN